MLKPEMELLFQDPQSEARLLRAARVVEAGEDAITIEFGSQAISVDEGMELVAFFLGDNQFMQQVVRVREITNDGDRQLVDLEFAGDPESAEARANYRATSISADMAAEVGEERDLTVQDVSSTGFAVVTAGEYPIGTVLDVAVNFEGDLYSGTASVQSVRVLGSNRTRCGMQALDEGDLRDGLDQICAALQRQQLQQKDGSR